MAITYHKESKTFTLSTKHSTYQMKVEEHGLLLHLYYGKIIQNTCLDYLVSDRGRCFSGQPQDIKSEISLDVLPQEYSTFDSGDYRESCLNIIGPNGETGVDLRYVSHEIKNRKPKLSSMPSLFGEDIPTLVITMKDTFLPIEVLLYYSVFEEEDAIARSVVIKNNGSEKVYIDRALSACLDFMDGDFDFIYFPGAWAAERMVERTTVGHAKIRLDSLRGTSSHQMNPFSILCESHTTEDQGSAYGASLVYSGNFLMEVQKDQFDQTRLVLGIHPQKFRFELLSEEKFVTPEVVLSFSCNGFSTLSHQFHNLFKNHLIRSSWKDQRRPILLNSWEAMYFDFNGEKLLKLAKEASNLGIEMFVLDDGWFGRRNDDTKSLGDWVVNEEKLGMSLCELTKKVNNLGLKFGIWIEPEMINEDSELYRQHSDYYLRAGDRPYVRSRNQLVLDMSRADIRDYLFESISKVLKSAHIEYVKWDMNRSLCNVWSNNLPANRQGEVYHRYVLGVYELLERLTNAFPKILFEGCSGGGGRFDAGMLYYFPQIWCSDNTDALARLKIQYGTSFCYPPNTMGSHVSICPNHQTGRITPMEMRSLVAMSGTFGYELDPSLLTLEEKEVIKKQIAMVKKYHSLLSDGVYYRLTNPFSNERYAAWEFVSPNKDQALICFILLKVEANSSNIYLRCKGLEKDAFYQINGEGVFGGDALMNAGIRVQELMGDYKSLLYDIKKYSKNTQ